MTLQPYDSDKLDRLALRLLDLAAALREMSHLCHDHQIENLALHDKKVLEWCENLERWLRKARAELEVKAIDARAARRVRGTSRQRGSSC
ncbi:MAG: hypothetical protein JW818_17110 [Pirellulales bacterium]|nr:hypothetical protein [Pirellulales bacterium]